uniref:Uncharacterized protein n=2 Tax=Marmotini TaxID=337730 RepID=A0A8C9UKE7_SPEDA
MTANSITSPSKMLLLELVDNVTEFKITPEGRRITKLNHILLSGNKITMLVSRGKGPEV